MISKYFTNINELASQYLSQGGRNDTIPLLEMRKLRHWVTQQQSNTKSVENIGICPLVVSPVQVVRHWSSSEEAANYKAWGCWWIFGSVSLKRPGNEFSQHVPCWLSHTRTSDTALLLCSLLPHGNGEWWQIVNRKKDIWQTKEKMQLGFHTGYRSQEIMGVEVLQQKRFDYDIRKSVK